MPAEEIIEFKVDRPFFFMIIDERTGSILLWVSYGTLKFSLKILWTNLEYVLYNRVISRVLL